MNKKIILGVVIIVAIVLAAVFVLPSSKNLFQGFIGKSSTRIVPKAPSSSNLPRIPATTKPSTEQSPAPEGQAQSEPAPEGQAQSEPAPEGQGQSGSYVPPAGNQSGPSPDKGQSPIGPPETLPDLAVKSISIDDKGAYVKLNVSFANKNATDIQTALAILLEASPLPSINSGGIVIIPSKLVDASLNLNGGAGYLGSDYSKTVYKFMPCSVYTLSLTLDANNSIIESDKTNNILKHTFFTDSANTVTTTPSGSGCSAAPQPSGQQ